MPTLAAYLAAWVERLAYGLLGAADGLYDWSWRRLNPHVPHSVSWKEEEW